jgi:carbamoyltransferase
LAEDRRRASYHPDARVRSVEWRRVIVLGIWDGHDAGAALLSNGRLVAAVNEERLTRRKLEVQFPSRSIQCCLDIARLAPERVDLVAISTADAAKTLARWFPSSKEAYYRLRRRKTRPGVLAHVQKRAKYWITEAGDNALWRRLSAMALRHELAGLRLGRATLRLLDHHACHAAAAAWASGFASCAVLTIDGVGDGLSSTVSSFSDGRLRRLAASRARDSLGIFFEHVTNLLNMRELEDEGKVMALADYAAPVPDAENPLLTLFTVRDGVLTAKIPGHAMMAHLRSVQWSFPNEQFAYIAQRTVEDVCVRLALDAVRLAQSPRLALAGGVASNVKANRRIRLLPGVDEVFVFPHMGDGGLALGAAIAASSAADLSDRSFAGVGLGPEYSDDEIKEALVAAGLTADRPPDLPDRVADLIAAGRIVMWFRGRMEYGPRALGFRSVLARPDRADLRDRLNLVLKQRVWYQPFCPSMLESEAPMLLADYDGRPNRHMTMAYMVAPRYRDALVGVTSVDGSCRPQMVRDDESDAFARVLCGVKVRTGVGAVLNTSYNIHGEPVVCTPREAIDVYLRTEADALAIGSYLAVRDGR